jgi:uncharacterized membrane protein
VRKDNVSSCRASLLSKSSLSKATVSRVLDSLEGKGLIIRQRHGMNNIILLK